MSIHFEHAIDVACPPEKAFVVLDDVSQTPKWLARCTGIEKLTPGQNAVGTKLRYSFREGGRTGVMDGETIERKQNERLKFQYDDKMMGVTVDFLIAKTAMGTRLVHAIDITPKTFVGRMMSPLIGRMMPKQTITAMETLRALLERG